MKNLKLASLGLAVMVCCAVSGQKTIPLNEPNYNKPLLFAELPDKIPVEASYLKNVLTNSSAIGKDVQFRLANSKVDHFSGSVISFAGKETGANSVTIRSSNFIGAIMNISEVTLPDGTMTYRGHVISMQHGDLLELQKIEGQYYFVKRKFYDLINE
ncbi:MAG TPA: hypothetical protein VF476_07945 [Chitinophagaceae bacterium]